MTEEKALVNRVTGFLVSTGYGALCIPVHYLTLSAYISTFSHLPPARRLQSNPHTLLGASQDNPQPTFLPNPLSADALRLPGLHEQDQTSTHRAHNHLPEPLLLIQIPHFQESFLTFIPLPRKLPKWRKTSYQSPIPPLQDCGCLHFGQQPMPTTFSTTSPSLFSI